MPVPAAAETDDDRPLPRLRHSTYKALLMWLEWRFGDDDDHRGNMEPDALARRDITAVDEQADGASPR